eukprot:TRINITY_DN4653_c0_g2_i3.p1 TRINITY_DN4653_c0_g2~~TRINITY_DN4653_c0_g2_i3.p1  ORF type:complete len:798 (-),score=179.88 TRINITY_DN4653_c0_g2_i3:2-2098(-)
MLYRLADRSSSVMTIELDDVQAFSTTGDPNPEMKDLVEHIEGNTLRYVSICYAVVAKLLPAVDVPYHRRDLLDVLTLHRERSRDPSQHAPPIPPELTCRYQIIFTPRTSAAEIALRQLKASLIGHLVTVKAMTTRVGEVKPLAKVITYTCDQCQSEVYQQVTGRSFLPLQRCTSARCTATQNPGVLRMETRGSKFEKFQEIQVQELTEQVPTGQTPRSLPVHLHGVLTQHCTPGDLITISGVYLATTLMANKSIRVGLTSDTFVEAHRIEVHKKNFSAVEITPERLRDINAIAANSNAFSRLAASIAPAVYGHDDIKKAVLLQLIGGPTRTLPDGMKIRGDINIIMIGDPGVAKSQILKQISSVAPRAVYTTGKGASGVGLTAAVLRDPVTNEFILEGGSLVLADMGVCCIDEFDKMDDTDRTSIHEVMEQQTVSVAKAGITTTLNARASVLAAANPAYGRYNPHRSPSENINMPVALLSRFDILFVLLDKPDPDADRRLAEHLTYVHLRSAPPKGALELVDPELLRCYIAHARKFEPYVPQAMTDYIVNAYVSIRKEEAACPNYYYYTSARTLLAILRLSMSMARLRLSDEVNRSDVDEAISLMNSSKASLSLGDRGGRGAGAGAAAGDFQDRIYGIVRDYSISSNTHVVPYDAVVKLLLHQGFTQTQIDQAFYTYQHSVNVWEVDAAKTRIKFTIT